MFTQQQQCPLFVCTSCRRRAWNSSPGCFSIPSQVTSSTSGRAGRPRVVSETVVGREQVFLLTEPSYKCQKHLLLVQFPTEDVQVVVVDSALGSEMAATANQAMGSLPSGLRICTTAPDIFYLPELVSRLHQSSNLEGQISRTIPIFYDDLIQFCWYIRGENGQQDINSVQNRLGEV